jgi:hypothetical protein
MLGGWEGEGRDEDGEKRSGKTEREGWAYGVTKAEKVRKSKIQTT